MNKTIWKYPITHPDRVEIEMPKGAELLTIQCQDNTPTIWALVNPDKELDLEKRNFELFGTGHDVPCDMGIERKYINTFQMNTGLVFHLFERL